MPRLRQSSAYHDCVPPGGRCLTVPHAFFQDWSIWADGNRVFCGRERLLESERSGTGLSKGATKGCLGLDLARRVGIIEACSEPRSLRLPLLMRHEDEAESAMGHDRPVLDSVPPVLRNFQKVRVRQCRQCLRVCRDYGPAQEEGAEAEHPSFLRAE